MRCAYRLGIFGAMAYWATATTGIAVSARYPIAAGSLVTFGLGVVPHQPSNEQEAVPDVRACELRARAVTEGPLQHSIPTTTACPVSP